jgi:hypothetical protein
MNKLKRSGRLLKAAFAVLFREKKLLFFPAIGSGLALVMAIFFLLPITFYPTGQPYFSTAHWSALAAKVENRFDAASHHRQHQLAQPGGEYVPPQPYTPSEQLFPHQWWTAPLFALMYFVSMFLATFSNVAFYHEIMQALNGQAVSIRRGFRFATGRWRAILLWSLFAGAVGYLINAIEQRVGFLGRFITGFIGMAWSVACIFVIPTLVRDTETVNPLKLVRNSAGTLKRTWGELVIGFAGLELAFGLVFFSIFLAVFSIGFLGGSAHLHLAFGIIFAGLGGVFLFAMVLSWISSVVNPVYRCALYIYATEGVIPGKFDQELLDSAWKVK